jgi:hypothetical protein
MNLKINYYYKNQTNHPLKIQKNFKKLNKKYKNSNHTFVHNKLISILKKKTLKIS